mgnify:CR=1 FL=1
MVPEASNGFKLMFFHALVIQGPSQIDPGLIWEKLFFHENHNFDTKSVPAREVSVRPWKPDRVQKYI